MPAGPDNHVGGAPYQSHVYEQNNNHVTSGGNQGDESAHSIFQSVKEQVPASFLCLPDLGIDPV